MRNLDQVRMKAAYRALEEQTGKHREVWLSAVKGFGPEVQRSGLLQALAFMHRGPTKDIAPGLCDTLRVHLVSAGHLPDAMMARSFLEEVRDAPFDIYMRLTREVLVFSVWLKRAAQIAGDESKRQKRPQG